jgi:hypothetical protein
VAEKRKWDRQQRLEDGLQGRHQGVQMRDRHLPDALAMTRQFYGTEIDIEGHVRPPRSIEEGVACRMRKPDDAQSSRGVVAPERDPFVEHDTIPNLAVSNGAERTR